ncbi:MAG: Hpt domain-containing protein [Mesorhizobium sp.]|nr:Hpt domain-containing protein [Mesorhizobium sp.]MBL8578839.1 Hpt domain-containing protein [Mesorhizobium sp.]
MPGGETSGIRHSRPIDLAHLSIQTMGDRDLEREVLGMFVDQAQSVRRQLSMADLKERLFLAHTLKGSARGVGAFPIADCAAEMEERPTDKLVARRLEKLIDEACDFIASIDR